MAVIKAKPTSAGRRFVQTVKTSNLHKGRPHKSLTTGLKKTGGRNNYGRMTTRHIGGGHKRLYREIDFKRNKDDVSAAIASELSEFITNAALKMQIRCHDMRIDHYTASFRQDTSDHRPLFS